MAEQPESFVVASDRIFTMDERRSVVSGALVIQDGKIRSIEQTGFRPSPQVPFMDFGSRPILPGFVDPHVHLEMTATAMFGAVDCHTPPVSSIDELLAQLTTHAALRELRGGWLVGQGGLFAARRFADQRLPTRVDLDRVSTKYPIAVRFGAHVTVVNTAALDMAMQRGLPQTGDAHVVRTPAGEPTGELHELFYALPIRPLTDDQIRSATVKTATELLIRYGVTAIGEVTNTMPGMEVLADLARSPDLPLRVRALVWAPGTMALDTVLAPGLRDRLPASDDNFAVHGIKIFIDGGFSAGGAAVLRPYVRNGQGDDQRGRLGFDLDALRDVVRRADEAGLQVTAHVNGERAQRLLCEAAVAARPGGRRGSRPIRLEHAGNVVTDYTTIGWWARAEAVAVPQAGFLWTLGSFIPESMGDYSRPGLFPFRELLDRGIPLCSSSDGAGSELLQFNPLFGVQCALTRRSCIGELLAPEQQITVMEALAMHTCAAADALGLDDTGHISTGQRADLIVLGQDPREVAPSEISRIGIDHMFVNGRDISRPS